MDQELRFLFQLERTDHQTQNSGTPEKSIGELSRGKYGIQTAHRQGSQGRHTDSGA